MRSWTIQLQNSDHSHCRWIGSLELSDLVNRGSVDVFERKAKGRKNKVTKIIARLKPQPEPLRTIFEASAPCITMSDMLANVGLDAKVNSTSDVSRSRQRAAQEKIAAFAPTYRFSAQVTN